jgi:hypothetical protein
MFALMSAHIDEFGCAPDRVDGSFNNRLRGGDKCYDGPIVIAIDMRIEDTRRFDGRDRLGNQPDSFRVSPFAEVRNTLD